MQPWLEGCERRLSHMYQSTLGKSFPGEQAQLRWLSGHDLTDQVMKEEAQAMVIEDMDIGLLLFLLPYTPDRLNAQINQSVGLRSRLQREANYTGDAIPGEQDDRDSTWRISLIWLVNEQDWDNWQYRIRQLRQESGVVEEISIDAVCVKGNEIEAALDAHGLPRLLLNTRKMLTQTEAASEKWLSADAQVAAALAEFAQRFSTPHTREFANRIEELTNSFQSIERQQQRVDTRQFHRFCVKQFRNLHALDIAVTPGSSNSAQAIILFGPNGTGKSSFAEALSLAAFNTSTRLEQFLEDKDILGSSAESYLKNYLAPFNDLVQPTFIWDDSEEQPFSLRVNIESKHRFEGIVLSQEDPLQFTQLTREELATRVLKGYSNLADHLSAWISQEEKRSNELKLAFTRKHNLSNAIKRSDTAYSRLAQGLLQEEFDRPPRQFLDWLSFVSHFSSEDGQRASQLAKAWSGQQANTIPQLSELLAKLQAKGSPFSSIVQAIRESLDEYDRLAYESSILRKALEDRTVELRNDYDQVISQMETWGTWLASRVISSVSPDNITNTLQVDIEEIAKERIEIVNSGKVLEARLDLLEKASHFLSTHWATQNPDICPVCESNVANRKGIEAVVTLLQQETNSSAQALRSRYAELQGQQKELDAKIHLAGTSVCPLTVDQQAQLRVWLEIFLLLGAILEDWLMDSHRRKDLKDNLSRIRFLPEAPKPYADIAAEANRLAKAFISLVQEADRALEEPQAVAEVKKAFEQRMEDVLTSHLPSTLGKVWQEITLTLTTAPWLLVARPGLQLGPRGKSLSVQLEGHDLFVRYFYNAAERHILGLAWFFTYYLAHQRHKEAWVLLDDPAQEMDQPSFRELVRFWETLLRLHNRTNSHFTLIATLHQEDRALDATRATNGRLYTLGWQHTQDNLSDIPSVKEVLLLAPGFHPLKPEKLFRRATSSPTT